MESKIRIILFGAADTMFQAAEECLRQDNCEIVAICDNNEYKQGIYWNDLPILSVRRLNEIEYDFILIGAWYSYQQIKNDLLAVGIVENKILPLLSMKTIPLLVESIEVFPEEVLSKIFRDNPKRLNEKILELREINQKYLDIPSFKFSNNRIDFNNYPLIAHAGGGVVDKQRLIYSNSIEAFQTSIEVGFKMIECDIWGITEDDLSFGHDSEKVLKSSFAYYTPLTFTSILSILVKNPELKVMLDIKWSTFWDYKRILDKMESIISESGREWDYEIKQQIVVQTYNSETIEYAVKQGWNCVLISYRNPEGSWFKKTAYLCCKFNILGAVFNAETLLAASKYLKFLKDKNVPIIAYTTDDINEYSRLKELKVASVITNFLRP